MTWLAAPRRIAPVGLLLALTVRGAASPPQILPTNGAPDGPRTGMIAGQVVDAAGTPVPEAIVRLAMPKFLETLPTTPKGRVMADGEGRYFFADLPAGDYYLQASKDGYASGTYGQRSAASSQGQLFTLSEAERRNDVKLTLWKYAVIAGTVVDEAGEAVVGVGVEALAKGLVGGRARYGEAAWLVPTAITDDRGMFRLAQVLPGTYVVHVPSVQTTLPVAVLDAAGQDAALRTELFYGGITEVVPLGQPRVQQAGDFAMLTLNRVLIPPPPTAVGRMEVYRATYFPSAATAAAATPIALASGEERSDLTIALRPIPAARISGRLVTPDGSAPPLTAIRLVGDSAADVLDMERPSGSGLSIAGFETASGMSDARGRFVLLGVPPGEYLLKHGNPFLSGAVRQGRPAYWISQRITVGTNDLDDLVVQLRPALRVEGRTELKGASGGQTSVPPMLTRGPIVFETPFGERGQFVAEGRSDAGSFATVATPGQYIVRAIEIGGWVVQSITMDGKDITDRVFELQSDTSSIVITYTDRPSKVSGTVKDARGAVSPDAIVLAFPTDPARWSGYGASPRLLKSVLTTRTSVYTFEHLPAGEYFVIAIDGAQSEDWRDPAKLKTLAPQATRLTVAAGDATLKTLDLTVRTIR